MKQAFYSDSIQAFLGKTSTEILGELTLGSDFDVEQAQRGAWLDQIQILKSVLTPFSGSVFFEYSIPRMGLRIDVVLIISAAIFVLEFKVGEKEFPLHALDQVEDYALDLKNFHEPSHSLLIAPILVATAAKNCEPALERATFVENLYRPIRTNAEQLGTVIEKVLDQAKGPAIDAGKWLTGRYRPTPTIIEAALALYRDHSVADISRSDAEAINLSRTSNSVSAVIEKARATGTKAICFVTGVPGAGKTLVGLNLATKHMDKASELHSVFLSGNGPLVAILREALARDTIRRAKEKGNKLKKGAAMSEVKAFIQNVHHYRDTSIRDSSRPPIEHVAIFDEAQRAWNLEQTANFMRRKKGIGNFTRSEPEFLISCLDRYQDWAVIVCLVGGGQEINTGEAGISEWIEALMRSFPDWHIYVSPQLNESEYGADEALRKIETRKNVTRSEDFHLGVSMRSFRAESVSLFVRQVLDLEASEARKTLEAIGTKYPIHVTRDIAKAKEWLRKRALGTARFGIVVSSQAERLRPHAIHVKAPMNPIHWFLDGKEDVRSSYYLEDVATEFHVQGLELDWTCVVWDADFRHTTNGWQHRSFRGHRWNQVKQDARKHYLKNAYRVLLTRARQGMVIVVPPGARDDPTRSPEFYDPTFEYLKGIGIPVL
jgi:Schlafen group 3, DNA/RNA helicase domain